MLVWVMSRLSQQSHEVLELLDLVEVVNEGLADLLDKKRSISNFELHLLLNLVVALGSVGHLLRRDGLAHLPGALQSG